MEPTKKDWKFIGSARMAAISSHDIHTAVGAVVAIGNKKISQGSNQIPPGVEIMDERLERPAKYAWMAHAEVSAIFAALKSKKIVNGDLSEATLYSTKALCGDCMMHVILSGIRRVVMPSRLADVSNGVKWQDSMWVAEAMAEEAGVEVVYCE